jgi:hypothetical protein
VWLPDSLISAVEEQERLTTEEFARWWKQTGEHELRQVLYWAWDPMGVNSAFPFTTDEYDGYAPQVVQALRHEQSESDIAERLDTIGKDTMGLDPAPEHSLWTARRILQWYRESQRHWREFGPLSV